MTFETILATPPYSLAKADKDAMLTERLVELSRLHEGGCE